MDHREGDNIEVILQETPLWEKFHLLTNEMIVTKNGRRMFPVIKVEATGLDPSTLYQIWLEFKQIETNRYKYINGEWHPGMSFWVFTVLHFLFIGVKSKKSVIIIIYYLF